MFLPAGWSGSICLSPAALPLNLQGLLPAAAAVARCQGGAQDEPVGAVPALLHDLGWHYLPNATCQMRPHNMCSTAVLV